jgi:hypothetical protein
MVALFSWVVLHVPINPYDLVINHKHTHTYISPEVIMINIHHIVKDSFNHPKLQQLSIIYPKHLFKRVVQCNKDKILVMSLKR